MKVSYLTTPIVHLVQSSSQCERELQGQKVNSICLRYKNSYNSESEVIEIFKEFQQEKVIRIKSIPEDFTTYCRVC